MSPMKKPVLATLATITLIFLGGCASDSQVANSIKNRGVDAETASLNLPSISSEYLEVSPKGQLVSKRTAIFSGSEGLPYLLILERPLFRGYDGREVSLDEPTIRIGHSLVRTSRYSKWENERFEENKFDITGGLEVKKSRVKAIYKLRNEEHVQEVQKKIWRAHRK